MSPRRHADDTGPATRRPAVINALTAVEVLAAERGGMGLVQLASALDLDPAQVRRMLRHLIADGWVSQAGDTAPYTFGARMLALSGRVLGNLSVYRAGEVVVRELRDASGETVHLGLLRDGRLVCIARELSTHSVVAVATAVGDSWPVRGSAMGAAVRSAMLLPADDGADDPEAAEARRRGYGIDLGHHRSGIVALAAPVFDYRAELVGALAVSGPENRLGPDRHGQVGRMVADAAARLSAELGHRPQADGAGR
jgi:DNA-binding IclR family transcriptional regulator